MADLANIAIDPRSPVEMLNRIECQRVLSKAGINHDPHIKKIDAIKLIEANNLNVQDYIEFEPVNITKADGGTSQKWVPKRIMPKRPENYDQLRDAEMERRLESAAEQVKKEEMEAVKSLKAEVSELKSLVFKLAEMQQSQLEKTAEVKEVTVSAPKEIDPHKMKYMAFKKWCKERGYELKKGEKREEVIAYLEKSDGEDAT